MPKPDKNIRLDRHSGMGVNPEPKKGGSKGWGKPGEDEGPEVLDERDPNFVDESSEMSNNPQQDGEKK